MSLRRKHKSYSIALKQQLIKDYDSGMKNKELCDKYLLHHSTIIGIIQNREKILGFDGNAESKKRIKKGTTSDSGVKQTVNCSKENSSNLFQIVKVERMYECQACGENIKNPKVFCDLKSIYRELTELEPPVNDEIYFCNICTSSLISFRHFKKLCAATHESLSGREPYQEPEIPVGYEENVVEIKVEQDSIALDDDSLTQWNAESFSHDQTTTSSQNEEIQTQKYICDMCNYETKSRGALVYHMTKCHTDIEIIMITCPFENCNEQFRSKSSEFYQHVRDHQNRGDSCICDICGNKFATMSKMRRHRPVHNTEKKFKCKHCDARFTNTTNLYRHERYRHKLGGEFMCSFCGFITHDPSILFQHKRRHHSSIRYQCDECPKEFKTPADLKDHNLIHTKLIKDIPCPKCDAMFKLKAGLRSHLKKFHKEERVYKCEPCSKTFLMKAHLDRHSLIHDMSRKYKCDFCDQAFTQLHVLKRHLTLHTGEKPFTCPYCNQGFVENYKCKTHSLTCEMRPKEDSTSE